MIRTHLYPSTRSGLRVAEARSWRIGVEHGALVERRPGTDPRVVAAPGELSRAVLLRGPEVPRRLRGGLWHMAFMSEDLGELQAVAFLADDEVRLVVGAGAFTPMRLGTLEEAARTSGLLDVVDGLGLRLERADPRDLELVRRSAAVTRGPVTDVLARRLAIQGALVLVALLGIVGVALADSWDPPTYLVPGWIALAALVAITVDQWILASRFLRTVGDRTVPTLRIGTQDVVLAADGAETWVPGPAGSGVVACDAADDTIFFLDRHDSPLLVLHDAPSWYQDAGETALSDACRAAGIAFTRLRVSLGPDAAQRAAIDSELRALAGVAATLPAPSRPLQRIAAVDQGAGQVMASTFLVVGLVFVLAVVGLDPEKGRGVPELVVAAVAALALAATGLRTWRLRRWDRSRPLLVDRIQQVP